MIELLVKYMICSCKVQKKEIIVQKLAKPSGINSANENAPWAEYYPQAEALIRKRFGHFNTGTMFGVESCRYVVAFSPVYAR